MHRNVTFQTEQLTYNSFTNIFSVCVINVQNQLPESTDFSPLPPFMRNVHGTLLQLYQCTS